MTRLRYITFCSGCKVTIQGHTVYKNNNGLYDGNDQYDDSTDFQWSHHLVHKIFSTQPAVINNDTICLTRWVYGDSCYANGLSMGSGTPSHITQCMGDDTKIK